MLKIFFITYYLQNEASWLFYSFIHLVSRYLLRTLYVPGTQLHIGDSSVSKTNMALSSGAHDSALGPLHLLSLQLLTSCDSFCLYALDFHTFRIVCLPKLPFIIYVYQENFQASLETQLKYNSSISHLPLHPMILRSN